MIEHGTLVGFPGATESTAENPHQFLLKQADCMIPAAVEKVLHMGNAE